MHKRLLFTALLLVATMGLALSFTDGLPNKMATEEKDSHLKLSAEDPFTVMMKVLTHKRCVNCHPNGDRPHQGEDSHVHNFGVERGPGNHGVAGLQCSTCHQSENNNYSGVPGAPEWSLAPIDMYWEGLSRVEIARSMTDPEKNGGRSIEELVHHLTEHELVLWAWEPGVDAEGNPRELPPVPLEEYITAVKAWAEAGAVIPES